MKKLYRNENNKFVAGVAAGLADYFKIDVSWLRLGMVAATLLTAVVPAILLYVAAWLIVPTGSTEYFDYSQ